MAIVSPFFAVKLISESTGTVLSAYLKPTCLNSTSPVIVGLSALPGSSSSGADIISSILPRDTDALPRSASILPSWRTGHVSIAVYEVNTSISPTDMRPVITKYAPTQREIIICRYPNASEADQ